MEYKVNDVMYLFFQSYFQLRSKTCDDSPRINVNFLHHCTHREFNLDLLFLMEYKVNDVMYLFFQSYFQLRGKSCDDSPSIKV